MIATLTVVCAWCKGVKCADGTFSKPLAVLLQGDEITHGVCPACLIYLCSPRRAA